MKLRSMTPRVRARSLATALGAAMLAGCGPGDVARSGASLSQPDPMSEAVVATFSRLGGDLLCTSCLPHRDGGADALAVDGPAEDVATPVDAEPAPADTPAVAPDTTSVAADAPLAESRATLGGCAMFPPDSPWNQDISALPVHPNSAVIIANVQAHGEMSMHPDFGATPGSGIPFALVPSTQPRVPVTFDEYGSESDPGPYPSPLSAPVEAGNDRHVLVVQQGSCALYELYHATRGASGWTAGSGAVFDLGSNALRPGGWTSCDQAGLPILPGLARYDEVTAGGIHHALRVTFRRTDHAWIAPATHPGRVVDPDAPPMGLRLRLRASFDVSRFRGQSRVILEALRRYGMFVADTGGNWFLSGASDLRWDDDDLHQLTAVPGAAFEAVYTGETQR